MKIRNIKPYKDKESGEFQKVGDMREVAAKRGKEIIKKGVAVEITEEFAENSVTEKE